MKYDLADGVGDERLECAWGQLRQEIRTTLRINAVCNRQLATYRHYVVKIGRSRSKLCFLRNPFGQMNTICTSLTLTECLRCYHHMRHSWNETRHYLVKTGQNVLPNNLWGRRAQFVTE